MISSVDKYLQTLLAFVPQKKANRLAGDYISLIHVPASGSEVVYSLTFDPQNPVLTVARYQKTIWDIVDNADSPADLDALQADVAPDHPIFDFFKTESLAACENVSDGLPGMDYFLMLWQKDGQANVVECWEPYARNNEEWLTVIGGLQVLSSQFQYAVSKG